MTFMITRGQLGIFTTKQDCFIYIWLLKKNQSHCLI